MSDDASLDDFVESQSNEQNETESGEKMEVEIPPKTVELPSDWRLMKLQDIGNLKPSNVDKKSRESEASVKLCNYMDVYDNEYITNELDFMKATASEREIDRFLLDEGDVIFTKDSEDKFDIAVPAVVQEQLENVLCGYHLFLMKPNNEIVHETYLSKSLQHYPVSSHLGSRANGTTRFGLTVSSTERAKVPIPPLSEQQQIATVLYNIDQAIQKTEEVIEYVQKIKQGVMSEVFETGYFDHNEYETIEIGPFSYQKPQDWEIVSIKQSKKGENGLRRGPFGGMLKKEIFVESGYKVYQQKNVINNNFDSGDYYITEKKFKDMERFSIESGDILITCSGTLGKIAVVPDKSEDGVINQALLKLSVSEDMFDNHYMKYFLQSKIGQRQLILSSRGSAMKNMAPMEFVRSSRVFKPKKSEQRKIANMFQDIDYRIDHEKRHKSQLQRIKEGLMQDLLSGDVRTTDADIDIPEEVAKYG